VLIALVALLAGCAGPAGPSPTSPAQTAASVTPGAAIEPLSPVALQDTRVDPFEATDFDAVHGPGDREPIFGALPIEPAAPDVPAETAAFLGRWEGYGLAPPIRRDWKFVLAITSITPRDGTAHLWAATNLQFPQAVERIHFRVRGAGAETAIEWEQTVNGVYAVVTVTHATGTDALEATTSADAAAGRMTSILLRSDAVEMAVDRDHAARLATFGITWRAHEDPALAADGGGELVYLPPGYDDDPTRRWPLVLFLHGSGDRGDNGLVLAQNSPFRYITGGGALDAVVVAPLLAADRPSFPERYLDGVLGDAIARYRVDPARVAVTGLSMGGEAAYRLARHRSDEIAALAVLCGFETEGFPTAASWGYQSIAEPWSALSAIPVRVIHGRNDITVPVAAAEAAVAAMRDAGVDVRLDILEHHDHDVWSDTYSDPAFYAWLLRAIEDR
jgi:pimeloyl-ACP methyl ester carboxylesterase